MGDSIRERVVQAIAARLRTISPLNGDAYTVGTVARAVAQFEPPDLPAISVWDEDEESADGYGFALRKMTLRIESFADACDDNHSTVGNRLLAAVKRALLSYDPPLDQITEDIAYQGGTINYPEPGGDVVATEQRLLVTYRETLGEPDQQPPM